MYWYSTGIHSLISSPCHQQLSFPARIVETIMNVDDDALLGFGAV
jgi:hypothetical protein